MRRWIIIVEHLRIQITGIPGRQSAILKKNSDHVFMKNKGYLASQDLSYALTQDSIHSEISQEPMILSAYTHAPFVSVDVEWFFLYLLNNRRHNLTRDNVEKYLVVLHNFEFLSSIVVLHEISIFFVDFSINAE